MSSIATAADGAVGAKGEQGTTKGRLRVLEALGFDSTMAAVYRLVLTGRSWRPADLARRLDLPEPDVRAALDRMVNLDLLHRSPLGDELQPVNPAIGLRDLLDRQKQELRRRQDTVDRSEADLVELSDAYSQAYDGYTPHPTEHLIGLDVVRRRIEDLSATVVSECLTFSPGGAQSPESLQASKPLDQAVLSRGVKMCTLYLDSVRNDPGTTKYAEWLRGLGGEVRTVPSLPIRMIIFDRRTVITPADPENTRLGGVQLTEPGVVVGLSDLFDRIWASATPLGLGQEPDTRGLTRQEQEFLRLLGSGLTDQVVARRMGVSPRTTRRMMVDLMQRLDANSRFQAGLQAARRQWV